MINKMKRSDIWLVDVLFKGTRQTKQRPVIIVGNELALDFNVITIFKVIFTFSFVAKASDYFTRSEVSSPVSYTPAYS